MTDYLLQILSTILLSLNFATTKLYQKREGNCLAGGLLFNALTGLFSIIIFFFINGMKFEITPFSLVMATLTTVLTTACTIIGFNIMKSGTVAFYTMFLMSGGMLVPYFWGLIFLGEKIDIFNVLGIICMISGIILMNGDFKKVNKKQVLLCLSVFFLNGFVSVVSKEHQINGVMKTVSASGFIALMGVARLVLCIIAYLFVPKAEEEKLKNMKKSSFGIVFLCTALSGVSYLLQLLGAKNIPATVLYPIITGGAIIFTAIASRIFFKEILHKREILAIAFCFVGTLLFI